MKNKNRMNQYFMDVARRTSMNSYAQRNKVGAVIVKNGRIISTGWNGQPKGLDNSCEYVDEHGNLVTKPTVIHAEANAITFCSRYGIPTEDTDLYVTLSPCMNCALLIIQAGIRKVYYSDEYRNIDAIEFLKNSGIEVEKL